MADLLVSKARIDQIERMSISERALYKPHGPDDFGYPSLSKAKREAIIRLMQRDYIARFKLMCRRILASIRNF